MQVRMRSGSSEHSWEHNERTGVFWIYLVKLPHKYWYMNWTLNYRAILKADGKVGEFVAGRGVITQVRANYSSLQGKQIRYMKRFREINQQVNINDNHNDNEWWSQQGRWWNQSGFMCSCFQTFVLTAEGLLLNISYKPVSPFSKWESQGSQKMQKKFPEIPSSGKEVPASSWRIGLTVFGSQRFTKESNARR